MINDIEKETSEIIRCICCSKSIPKPEGILRISKEFLISSYNEKVFKYVIYSDDYNVDFALCSDCLKLIGE